MICFSLYVCVCGIFNHHAHCDTGHTFSRSSQKTRDIHPVGCRAFVSEILPVWRFRSVAIGARTQPRSSACKANALLSELISWRYGTQIVIWFDAKSHLWFVSNKSCQEIQSQLQPALIIIVHLVKNAVCLQYYTNYLLFRSMHCLLLISVLIQSFNQSLVFTDKRNSHCIRKYMLRIVYQSP